nr:hypothetical protein [Tanacetum cinerariifolium]
MGATDEGVRPDFQILLKMDKYNDTADGILVDPPEDCISDILSLTLPCDASRAAAISKTFNITVDSDFREIHIMAKLPKCSCAAREDVSKHNQLIKLMQFLMGLNDVFQPIRSSLLARETLPDVKEAFAIISREESHIGITSSSSSSVTKHQVSSFVAKSNSWTNNGNKKFDNNKRIGNSSNNRGPNPKLHCTNCGNVGHTVDRCFDIIGYPRYNKNHGPKPNGPRTFNANFVSLSFEK